ncbi:MAG: heme NO-binding domain-containing protein [Pseudomonadota bacterium]
MRGLLFTEFMDFLEQRFDDVTVDKALEEANPASRGAYTTVDNYPAAELYRILACVASAQLVDADTLLVEYGRHLFKVFLRDHAAYFATIDGTITLMERVQDHIHVEVKKLHPDAKPPRFEVTGDQDTGWTVHYYSHRPLHAVAHGLMQAARTHFSEDIDIVRDVADGAQDLQAVFRLLEYRPG